MHIQIVMNARGDSRHVFDPSNPTDVEDAYARFSDLKRHGFTPVGFRSTTGPGQVLHSFDPSVQRTLFIPQIRGG